MSDNPGSNNPLVSMVVNYYNPRAIRRVDTITTLCLESLKDFTRNPLEVILSNGSGVDSPVMIEFCQRLGFRYSLCPIPQNFEAIYNHGLGLAQGDFVGILENDIFVNEDWDKVMIAEMRRTSAHVAVPYLTSCDNIIQQLGFVARHLTFEPTMISHNMILFDRTAFPVMVPFDTQFNATHNDNDLYLRLKTAGIRMIVCGGSGVIHYRRAAAAYNPWTFNEDFEKFKRKYPDLRYGRDAGSFSLADRRFCRSSVFRLMLWTAGIVRPRRAAAYLSRHLHRFEPLFHRI
jgi:GT2 family glycosyltransferase